MFKKQQLFTGIDFRTTSMITATVNLENKTPALAAVNTIELEKPLMENTRIMDIQHTAARLKEAFASQPKAKQIHLAFPTQNILIRRLTHLPDLQEKALAKLVDYQVGESIHLPFDTPIYDFVKIGSLPATAELPDDLQEPPAEQMVDKSDLLFFATAKELSEDFLEMVSLAGLKPLTAEIRGIALQRLLTYTNPDWLTATEMVVDLSDTSIDIHLFTGGNIVFSRTMFLSANDAMEQAAEDENVLPFDGFAMDTPIQTTLMAGSSAEERYIAEVAQEIEKAQNFFHFSLNKESEPFRRVIVTGKNTAKALAPLAARLETAVKAIDFSLFTTSGLEKAALPAASVAIGLALKGKTAQKKK